MPNSSPTTTKSFFSKYFGTGHHQKPNPLPAQLAKLCGEVESVMRDEHMDISLQKLLELSTMLKRAKNAGFNYANCPAVEQCELLLQNYGVGVEVERDRRSFQTRRNSPIPSSQRMNTEETKSPPHNDSSSDLLVSDNATSTSNTMSTVDGRTSPVKLESNRNSYKISSHLDIQQPSTKWDKMLDPMGKVMIVQQAYCLVTTSPHHALIFKVINYDS
jgi:hypothetical protein